MLGRQLGQIVACGLLCVFFVSLSFLCTVDTTPTRLTVSECQSDKIRLSKYVKPTHYELALTVQLDKLRYNGRVEIELEFDQTLIYANQVSLDGPKPRIILHASGDLDISKVELVDAQSEPIKVVNFCHDKNNSQLIVTLARKPDSKSAKLKILFGGKISSGKMVGIFERGGIDATGEYKQLVVTQFETRYARTVFPVFDEPEFKATFGLSIEHAKGLQAISNMPPISEEEFQYVEDGSDYVRVVFERTPLMSSHLLAFAVGEMDHIETTILDGRMTLRMWTPVGRAEDARWSMEKAAAAYEYLMNYFQIELPIKKIDFVAVENFHREMGNWGLITFDLIQLLNGEREKTVRDENYALIMITRALAHNWLGNLVTMKWWDDSWLNEALARWIAYKASGQLFPELEGELYYLVMTMSQALSRESDPRDLADDLGYDTAEEHDRATYDKTHCIIKMLNDFVGDEVFQRGVRKYVASNMNKNTEADDFWTALQEFVGPTLDLKSIVDSWMSQKGFPLVEVKMRGPKHLILRQRKFTLRENSGSHNVEQDKTKWIIPISVTFAGNDFLVKDKIVLDSHETVMEVPTWFSMQETSWLKVNSDFQGFYRVHYDDLALVEPLLLALYNDTSKTIPMQLADRLNIISDTIASIDSDLNTDLNYYMSVCQIMLDMMENFKFENLDALIIEMTRPTHEIKNLEMMIIMGYYSDNRDVLFADGENFLRNKALADSLQSTALDSDVAPAIADCISLYESPNREVPPHMRKPVYAVVAVFGDNGQFLGMLERVKDIPSEEIRESLVRYIRQKLLQHDKNDRLIFLNHYMKYLISIPASK